MDGSRVEAQIRLLAAELAMGKAVMVALEMV
jgi:hypothetical protein